MAKFAPSTLALPDSALGGMGRDTDDTALSMGFKNQAVVAQTVDPLPISETMPPNRAKSQPNLVRIKTASMKKSINAAEYLQRRKRRGQQPEISASSVTNAIYNYPSINKTKPVASLFQSRQIPAWRNQTALSYQPLGIDGLRRQKASVMSSHYNTGRMV